MTNTPKPLLLEVFQILEEKNFPATYEYPGFIAVTIPNGHIADFGNANVDYTANWDGECRPDELIGFFMPATCTALELVEAIEGWYALETLQGVSRTIYDNVRKAMQDAEEIWGPGDDGYEQLMQAIAYDANQCIANFRRNRGGVE